MQRTTLLMLTSLLLLPLGAGPAGAQRRPAPVRTLEGVRWHDGLERTLQAARRERERGRRKAVLWLRMLGELTGRT